MNTKEPTFSSLLLEGRNKIALTKQINADEEESTRREEERLCTDDRNRIVCAIRRDLPECLWNYATVMKETETANKATWYKKDVDINLYDLPGCVPIRVKVLYDHKTDSRTVTPRHPNRRKYEVPKVKELVDENSYFDSKPNGLKSIILDYKLDQFSTNDLALAIGMAEEEKCEYNKLEAEHKIYNSELWQQWQVLKERPKTEHPLSFGEQLEDIIRSIIADAQD